MPTMLDVADSRKRRELLAKLNAQAQEAWRNPEFRAEFAADLTESILIGFQSNPIIGTLVDTQTVAFDDRVLLKETKGLDARWIARGGYIEASSLTTSITKLPRDTIGIHVSEMTDKFITNFSETAQTLRTLALRRLENEVLLRIWALLTSGAAVLPTAGTEQAAVNDAIDTVSEASETGPTYVAGPPSAISKMLDFTGFSQNTLDEINRTGSIGVYRGAPVVRLTNVKDGSGASVLDPNTLVIVAPDCGRVVNYGGLLSKEFEELDAWVFHFISRRDVGMILHHPERVVEIVMP